MLRKVLIIEDEPEIRAILAMSLEHVGGYQTVVAGDGIEGIESALNEAPDLILLDILMPRLDGFATCKRIKQDERLWHIPVVFLTARTDPQEVDRAMRAGAAGYITKPFDPLTLAHQIAEIADGGSKSDHQNHKGRSGRAAG